MRLYHWLIVTVLTQTFSDATRISLIDGLNTSIIEYPHQVTVLRFKLPICSGAIVSRQHILTTASCIYRYATLTLRVRMGSSQQTENGFVRRIYRIHEHPDFNRTNYDNDLALLQLWTQLPILDEVIPITLGTKSIPVNSTVEVIGWGNNEINVAHIANRNQTNQSKTLQKIKLTVISNDACREIYKRHNFTITHHMLCAVTSSNGYGTCRDDLGATLLYNSDLYGMLSYQVGCAIKKYPAVFTNIATTHSFADAYLSKTPWNLEEMPPLVRDRPK